MLVPVLGGRCAPRPLLGLLILGALLLAGPPRSALAVTIDFEGLTPFTAPGASLTGITVSAAGGILDEAGVAAVTGLAAPPGTVAVSGTNVLANLFAPVLTIAFDAAVSAVSLHTLGSLAGGLFGTITAEAFDGVLLVDSDASDPGALGDSGAPEDVLSLAAPGGITSLVLFSDIGGASSFLIDDLTFTPVPEPALAGLLACALAAGLWSRRHAR